MTDLVLFVAISYAVRVTKLLQALSHFFALGGNFIDFFFLHPRHVVLYVEVCFCQYNCEVFCPLKYIVFGNYWTLPAKGVRNIDGGF